MIKLSFLRALQRQSDSVWGKGATDSIIREFLAEAVAIANASDTITAESDYYPWGRRDPVRRERLKRLQIHRQKARHRNWP